MSEMHHAVTYEVTTCGIDRDGQRPPATIAQQNVTCEDCLAALRGEYAVPEPEPIDPGFRPSETVDPDNDLVEAPDRPTVEPENEPDVSVEIDIDIEINVVLNGRVSEVRDWLESHPEHAQRLLELERAGADRKGVVEAAEAILEETS